MDPRTSKRAKLALSTRRLPPAAVKTMRKWLKANCRRPYPTEAEKDDLVERTGLTKKKITQWFINARRRSPLVMATSLQRSKEDI